jgi:hypothetical protein
LRIDVAERGRKNEIALALPTTLAIRSRQRLLIEL